MRAGGPETYRYDVQGRRVRSINSTGQVIYSLYAQSGQLLFQRDERSGKRRQYIYLGGSLVAESDLPLVGSTTTVTYQHTDALGSPVAITNSVKTVIERREYEPYGYQTSPTLQDGPNYTGHVADAATGLIYMQQRYYDPVIGRFLSRDEVTAYEKPLTNFNPFVYANNNPYRFTDPDGRNGTAALGGILYETWSFVSGNGFHGSQIAGALKDGYDGEGAGALHAALQDAETIAVAVSGAGALRTVGSMGAEAVTAEAGSDIAAKGAHTVYEGVDKATGLVRYVGITARDVATRGAEHIAQGGEKAKLTFQAVKGAANLTKQEARVMEQKLINQYGGTQGGQLLNKINSIAEKYWDKLGISK
jgi:RHS repeat-associated protein